MLEVSKNKNQKNLKTKIQRIWNEEENKQSIQRKISDKLSKADPVVQTQLSTKLSKLKEHTLLVDKYKNKKRSSIAEDKQRDLDTAKLLEAEDKIRAEKIKTIEEDKIKLLKEQAKLYKRKLNSIKKHKKIKEQMLDASLGELLHNINESIASKCQTQQSKQNKKVKKAAQRNQHIEMIRSMQIEKNEKVKEIKSSKIKDKDQKFVTQAVLIH